MSKLNKIIVILILIVFQFNFFVSVAKAENRTSNHPSGKDKDEQRGNSNIQGKSHSNPDRDGVDKPYSADNQLAFSQGLSDFDGNNGCGNDNDFSDDNNGKCLGRVKKITNDPESSTIPNPTPQAANSSSATHVNPSQGSTNPSNNQSNQNSSPSTLANTGDFYNRLSIFLLALGLSSILTGLYLIAKNKRIFIKKRFKKLLKANFI